MGEPRTGPLAGYRVLELTTTVSGPMAAVTLADQGAEVIKIEPPFTGDTARFLGPARNGMAAMFATVNRNKKSVCLDLKADDERAIFLDLVCTADALIENYRPGVLDRLGLGYEALSAMRPELVYASITGYGSGPYENRRVFDPLIQATAGTAAAQGGADDPDNVRMIIFDKVTALTTAQGVTAALLERERTGRGQHLPITMLESALSYQWPDVMWSRTFVGDGVSAGPGELADWFPTFQAADGPVSIILVSDNAIELFSIWREASLHTDPRFATPALREANIDEFVTEVNALIADVPVAEVCETLDAFGVPVARVNTLDEVFDDAQVRHLGAIIETEHPDGGPMRIARPPVPFGGVRETAETFPAKHAPRLGEDSAAVLGDLGVDEETIGRLLARDAENAVAVTAMLAARAAAAQS
ncbi:MAG: CoA transferase [Actinomycetota bacterium]